MSVKEVESRKLFYPLARFHDRRRSSLQRVPEHVKNAKNCSAGREHFSGTMPRGMNWVGIACRREPACIAAQRDREKIETVKKSRRS
jgi:hypothetical protein